MVAYNFKAQFAPLVTDRRKQQTIRADRKRHVRPNEPVQLYVGMRTRNCRKLLDPDPICISVEPLLIHSELGIKMNDRWLSREEVTEIAIADGFDSLTDFYRFFRSTHGLPFRGVLIRWGQGSATA